MTVVVITGAAGNVGAKLRAHLEAVGGYELRLVDIASGGDPKIHMGDLADPHGNWTKLLVGADVVVHLAANPHAFADWPALIGPNIDAALNLYLAGGRVGVKKIVQASSVWASRARVGRDAHIGADDPDPGPSPYGSSKMFGERIAKAFWEAHGISSVAVRLGAVRPGDNPPTPADAAWEDEIWTSNRDACQGFQRAIDADVQGVLIVNLSSDNPGSAWSLAAARDALGYAPQDGYVAPPPAPPLPKPLWKRLASRR